MGSLTINGIALRLCVKGMLCKMRFVPDDGGSLLPSLVVREGGRGGNAGGGGGGGGGLVAVVAVATAVDD